MQVSDDGNKRFHLQMLQDVISRMASNTFLIKGWSITALGAMYGFWIKDKNNQMLLLIGVLTLFFWIHDAYYLRLERGFRNTYDDVRLKESRDIDFEIKPTNEEDFLCVMLRPILVNSYGVLLMINIILFITSLILLFISKQ